MMWLWIQALAAWIWMMATPVCAFLVYLKFKDDNWRKVRNCAIIAFIAGVGSITFGSFVLPDFLYEMERTK